MKLFPKFPNYVAMENLHAFTWLFQILICNLLSLICIYIQFSFLAVVIMICVYLSLGVKHGLDHLVIRLWMNGGHGLPMDKLLGTYYYIFSFIKPTIEIDDFLLLQHNLKKKEKRTHFLEDHFHWVLGSEIE